MDSSPVEYQCKLMNSRVDNVGKHFSYFFQGFSSYARRTALLRDKGDDLVDLITSFSNTETHNSTTRQQLHEFSHWLAMVQDFRDLSATRIVAKIAPTLQTYHKITADLKGAIKKCVAINERTKSCLETANKIKGKHGDNSAMFHTAFEAYRGSARETVRQAEVLREQAAEFEEQKLRDTREVLVNFVRSEMMFHCRAVEMYTAAYRSLLGISEERDLSEFLDAYELMDADGVNVPTAPTRNEIIPPQTRPRAAPRRREPELLDKSTSQPAVSNVNNNSNGDFDPVTESGRHVLRDREQQPTRNYTSLDNNNSNSNNNDRRPQTAARSIVRRQNIQLQESDTD